MHTEVSHQAKMNWVQLGQSQFAPNLLQIGQGSVDEQCVSDGGDALCTVGALSPLAQAAELVFRQPAAQSTCLAQQMPTSRMADKKFDLGANIR